MMSWCAVLTRYSARNAIATTSWVTFEIFRDLELLARVREEVKLCRTTSNGSDCAVQFDIDRLLRQPVLQAVYAEVLRLRMHFYIIRMSDKVDMKIQDWIIPRRKIIVTSTTAAHHDAKMWNTGLNNEHPINEFWAGRFLKAPMNAADGIATFSTKEMEGSWIPYGGGPRQCPGRHFAKRQILLTTALMVALFDCEIPGQGTDVKEDLSLTGFGGGMSKPAMEVPARIRRVEMKNM
jgi:cytochrome P450